MMEEGNNSNNNNNNNNSSTILEEEPPPFAQSSSSSLPKSEEEVSARMASADGGTLQQQAEKPRLVRVKRAREQAPIDTLWLEVSERPSKRHEPDIGTLTLSSKEPHLSLAIEDVSKKLLFRRVETISPSGEKGVPLYESLLLKVNDKKHVWENRKKQQESWKSKEKQEHLLAAAKEQHGAVAKAARFEQVWRSRRGGERVAADDTHMDGIHDFFHLYDLVRIDGEAEAAKKAASQEQAKREAAMAESSFMASYLPLLRECLPEVAADVEAQIASSLDSLHTKEDYVYDVYAMEDTNEPEVDEEDEDYPTVQILETEGYDWRELNDSDYDSEDSNAENNPLHDYPEEEDFGNPSEEESDKTHDSGDFDPDASDQDYDVATYNDQNNFQWSRRL
ncbi:hypothetical protein CY35_17G043000 [Sphagnum magellanicum]|nr:hypothetical protein CY35_17G043000 [Sphagnum magellanicum]KAH9535250.1 hypothetical protein CY35_17G043000 [Sphagnum magellanicum]